MIGGSDSRATACSSSPASRNHFGSATRVDQFQSIQRRVSSSASFVAVPRIFRINGTSNCRLFASQRSLRPMPKLAINGETHGGWSDQYPAMNPAASTKHMPASGEWCLPWPSSRLAGSGRVMRTASAAVMGSSPQWERWCSRGRDPGRARKRIAGPCGTRPRYRAGRGCPARASSWARPEAGPVPVRGDQ